MSDFAPHRATLDVVFLPNGDRLFVVELEFESGGLLKVWQAPEYAGALEALRQIGKAAGVPVVDAYARGGLI